MGKLNCQMRNQLSCDWDSFLLNFHKFGNILKLTVGGRLVGYLLLGVGPSDIESNIAPIGFPDLLVVCNLR